MLPNRGRNDCNMIVNTFNTYCQVWRIALDKTYRAAFFKLLFIIYTTLVLQATLPGMCHKNPSILSPTSGT